MADQTYGFRDRKYFRISAYVYAVAGQSKYTTCGRLKMHHPLMLNLSSFYSLSNAVSS